MALNLQASLKNQGTEHDSVQWESISNRPSLDYYRPNWSQSLDTAVEFLVGVLTLNHVRGRYRKASALQVIRDPCRI